MAAGGGPSRRIESGVERGDGPLAFPSSADPVRGWLNAAMTLSRLPAGEREQLREELEEHLRERIRDLMLAGHGEPQATRTAIDELGEAAGFAARYTRAAGAPRRRRIMQFTIVAAAGALLAGGAMTLMQAGGGHGAGGPSAVFQPAPVAESLSDSNRITVGADTTWSAFFEAIGDDAGMPIFVNWHAIQEELDAEKIGPEKPIGLALKDFRPAEALRLLNERLGGYAAIDMRMTEDRLTFATRRYFDRRELVLATYDLGVITDGLLNLKDRDLLDRTHKQVIDVVTSFVETEMWTSYGGDLGQIYAFNNKLFVQCPARLQPRVEWVLEEMKQTLESEQSMSPPIGSLDRPIPIVYIEGGVGTPGAYTLAADGVPLSTVLAACGLGRFERIRVLRSQAGTEVAVHTATPKDFSSGGTQFLVRPGDRIIVE